MESGIEGDLAGHGYSFEASPYISLSVGELHARFGAKFVFLVRRPDRVVSSFVHKDFYRRAYHVGDPALAPGFRTGTQSASSPSSPVYRPGATSSGP